MMETYTGQFYDYIYPEADTINVEDIAHALAHTCRFGGHTRRYYSVAEHALLVAWRVKQMGHDDLELAALHHDSHEAYVGDIPSPLKSVLNGDYTQIRDRADVAIAEHLGIDVAKLSDPVIKQADQWALIIEAKALMPSQGEGDYWSGYEVVTDEAPFTLGLLPFEAKWKFLAQHQELKGDTA